ncbi:hypothetical protein [Microbacterium sp. bgisy203]|uniref:hypothetical protein n=1 Tax=Microbacterium sp. bgisy203 TaxID=3413799 RepID=UPI003D7201C2
MPVIAYVLIVIVGVALWTASLVVVSRANPEDLIPFWRNPPHVPGKALALRVFGILLVVGGATTGGSQYPGSPLPIIAVVLGLLLPLLLVNLAHNRRVEAQS